MASPGDLFDVNCATRRVVDAVSFGADHFVCPWRGDQDWNRIPEKPLQSRRWPTSFTCAQLLDIDCPQVWRRSVVGFLKDFTHRDQ